MENRTRGVRIALERGLFLFSALLLLLAGTQAIAAQPAGGAPGPEVCKNCHQEKYDTFIAHRHGMKADARTPAAKGGCVTCHGDGTAHVKAGGGRGVGGIKNPGSKAMASEEKNGLCLTCHEGGKRMHWSQSLHASRDTTCTSCHKVHATNDPVREKTTQAEVCFTCHKEQRAQINRPYRHPIPEGKVVCSDCHNPHGSAGPKYMVRDSVNETCYQCHMEKRGPFVRSHQPVTEDCSICHNPHGSTNPFMVKVRIPFLCQSCHDQASHHDGEATLGAGGRSAVFQARGCENCHTQIHGSNAPSAAGTGTGRAFRR
ncbi:MAG: DmsE family decaheme c-type cytochrome [Betaproteobacteria bacterium]|nr:DmsE family decaheme c-type cytochrome [Betaproteobacteria bacterium]